MTANLLTPQELSSLRASLPAFAGDEALPPGLQAFCRFYTIDFSASHPQAEYTAGVIQSGQFQLMLHRWLQPDARANLLLVHGYFDHSGIYGRLVEYGLSRGCNVLIFDLPGHGLSSGEPAAIDDFSHYSRAMDDALTAAQLPRLPLWVIGQSTGCAAIVQYARSHKWPFARTVLLAPLVRPANWFRVRTAHSVLQRFVDDIPRRFNDNSSDAAFLDFVQRDPLQARHVSVRWVGALKRWIASLPLADLGVGPALVIQGERDSTVSWRYNLRIIQRLFPGSEVHYLPTAGHQLANEAQEIRRRYFSVIDRYLAIGRSK
jgi:lysophospholipase